MCGYNPIERLQNVEWDLYQRASFKGQVASGVLTLITVVATAIILGLNPNISYITGNYPTWIALGSFGGTTLILFAVFSCLHQKGKRQALQRAENERQQARQAEKLRKAQTETPLAEPTVSVEKDPIGHLDQVLIQPILNEFRGALEAVISADCRKMNRDGSEVEDKVKNAFNNCQELFTHFLQNKYIYVSELLRYFGPGKTTKSVALRRLIAAYNSGDAEKLQGVRAEYEAIARANDFTEIAKALSDRSKTNAELMQELPNLLADLFSLPDAHLKEFGVKVLNRVFIPPTTLTVAVNKELNTLRSLTTQPKKFAKQLEKLIKAALEEAHIPDETYDEWNQELITYMLNTTFKGIIFGFLGSVARNVRILKLMFKKMGDGSGEIPKKDLFLQLDKAFLEAESRDCITNEALQRDLFHLQSEINFGRKDETRKVALIALPEGDNRTFEQLEQDEVLSLFFAANEHSREELKKITQTYRNQLLKTHHVRLVAVPVAISDHPFKKFKDYEGTVKFAAFLLKGFFPYIADTFVKPRAEASMPKMDGEDQKKFDEFFKVIVNLLVDPIYDGAIGDTKFTRDFQRIITNEGEELAKSLDQLLLQEEISFEEIRDVWTRSVRDVARKFTEV